MTSTRFSYSRAYPVTPEAAFDWLLPRPLEKVFARRYGPIAPIVGAEQEGPGPWGEPGQQRTIRMSDGTTMRERLTVVERPSGFGYRISDVTGVLKRLISGADGQWAFERAGTGTRITWTWDVDPASSVATRLMPVFGRVWVGHARQAFEGIESGLLDASV